jgi:HAD superfamily hydrolase (TIGR01509 family)
MIRALIFDFDGLMMETEVSVMEAWQETFAAHGGELPREFWLTTIGSSHLFDPCQRLAEQTGKAVDCETLRTEYRARLNAMVAEHPLLPGVLEYIQEAKALGLKVAVASSSRREWVEGHLHRHSLVPHFDCIRCADDVKRTKPDPELFLAALEAIGTKPEEAIVLEDSPNGVRAAKEAGVFCVAVPGPLTREMALSEADLRLGSLEEMSLRELVALAERRLTP